MCWKSAFIYVGCSAVNLCRIRPVALLSSQTSVTLSFWKFAETVALISVLVDGAPSIQVSYLALCLLFACYRSTWLEL